MNSHGSGVSWVDLVIVAVLVVGLFRGRKRGMSEELLDVIKWGVIVVAAAFLYEPLGGFLASSTPFSTLSCYITMYALVVLLIKLFFTFLRHSVGDKLVGSDVFGPMEYYLGMMAGMFRYACVVVIVMAFLNARFFTAEEIQAENQFQEKNFGTIRFPTLNAMQTTVFQDSFLGRNTHRHLSWLLIRPTVPEEKGLGQSGIARGRERQFKETLDKR
jgi:uncharacterized membrane protein required for colicin V production